VTYHDDLPQAFIKREAQMAKVSAIPEGQHTVVPSLVLSNCSEALAFFAKALGAVETSRALDPSGKKVWHAAFKIGDSTFYCCDEFPEMGARARPASFWIYGEDIDARFERAVASGAKASMAPTDGFWGDRFGIVVDPYGNQWTLAQRVKNMSPAEMKAAADAFTAQAQKSK
jgi:PhnB protein